MKNKSILLMIVIAIFEIIMLICKSYIANYILIINFIFWLFLMILSYFNVGTLKYKKRTKIDSIQLIIIVDLLFLFTNFLFGVFRGFSYYLNITNIIMNFLSLIMMEIVRYSLIKNINSKLKFLISFLFIIPIYLMFNLDLLMIIPITLNSILITDISYNVGVIPCFIHIILFNLFNIIPIKPKMDLFINIFVSLIDIVLVFLLLYNLYKKDAKNLIIFNKKQSKVIYLIIILVVPYIMLLAGLGHYKLIGIVSDSMKPVFSRGAGVIYKKIDASYYDYLNIGDILVYESNGSYIVHRIVMKDNGMIITKGDNNESNDDIVYMEQYVGVVRAYIPFIGYPMVWLSK